MKKLFNLLVYRSAEISSAALVLLAIGGHTGYLPAVQKIMTDIRQDHAAQQAKSSLSAPTAGIK